MATFDSPRRFAGLTLTGLVTTASLLAATLWGGWVTREIVTQGRREVVMVQLSRVIGEFVEAEARSGRTAAETQARVAAYLKAVEASVQSLSRNGRTVLVAEAVVAGSVPDVTERVRADVAQRLNLPGAAGHGAD